jgi:hypothetical protein
VFANHSGGKLAEAVQACRVYPAELTGLNQTYFTFNADTPAHIVFFNHTQGDNALRIEKTLIGREEFAGK